MEVNSELEPSSFKVGICSVLEESIDPLEEGKESLSEAIFWQVCSRILNRETRNLLGHVRCWQSTDQ